MKLMSYIVFSLICAFQVKPLLQVTRQDEEIQARETQLLKAKENLNQVEQNYTDLERKHVQVDKPPPPHPTPMLLAPHPLLWLNAVFVTP